MKRFWTPQRLCVTGLLLWGTLGMFSTQLPEYHQGLLWLAVLFGFLGGWNIAATWKSN